MSHLILETDEYVIIEQTIHYDSDSYPDWIFDGSELKEGYSWEFVERAETAFYEFLIRAKVYKEDIPTEIIYIQDGDRKLT